MRSLSVSLAVVGMYNLLQPPPRIRDEKRGRTRWKKRRARISIFNRVKGRYICTRRIACWEDSLINFILAEHAIRCTSIVHLFFFSFRVEHFRGGESLIYRYLSCNSKTRAAEIY